jgi:hypothetical protein
MTKAHVIWLVFTAFALYQFSYVRLGSSVVMVFRDDAITAGSDSKATNVDGTPRATEIKQQLFNMGKDLSDQRNVMAGIHSLLKRLVVSGEIETRDNGLTYQSKGIRVLLSPAEPRPVYVEPRKLKRE